LSVYDLWLIVICLYNRVILDDFIPEFCNFEVGHSRILQFSPKERIALICVTSYVQFRVLALYPFFHIKRGIAYSASFFNIVYYTHK